MVDAAQPSNPYQAPTAPVSDRGAGEDGGLIEYGRRVPAGHGVGWYARAWALFASAPLAWIGIWLIYAVFVIVLSFLPIVGSIINIFLEPMLLGGVMLACRLLALLQLAVYMAMMLIFGITAAISVGGMAGLGVLQQGLPGFEVWLPIVIIAVAAFIPFMLFTMATFLAPALIVLHDIGPFDALRIGFLATLKNVLPMLVSFLIGVLLAIVASLPIFLGWLVLGPIFMCTLYAIYRDVFFD